MASKVMVILSTAEKDKALTGIMYAVNAQKNKWVDDLKVIFFGPFENLICDDEKVAQVYDDDVFKVVSQASEQIEAWAAGFKARRSIRWGITERENGEIIGTCGYYGFHSWHKRAGIGYELARSFWQQRIMTEALGAIIAFGFKRVELNRIEAVVMPDNEGSFKLLEGLGFQHEGVLREYEKWGNKGLIDLMMFSLLRREYRE